MTKAELIERMAQKAKISKRAAGIALNTVVDSITNALKNDDKVALVGFGTFSVSRRKARTARNPRTGEPIEVPAKRAPKFKAGRDLKNAVK
jgi:DNA-binding protein HU-beta